MGVCIYVFTCGYGCCMSQCLCFNAHLRICLGRLCYIYECIRSYWLNVYCLPTAPPIPSNCVATHPPMRIYCAKIILLHSHPDTHEPPIQVRSQGRSAAGTRREMSCQSWMPRHLVQATIATILLYKISKQIIYTWTQASWRTCVVYIGTLTHSCHNRHHHYLHTHMHTHTHTQSSPDNHCASCCWCRRNSVLNPTWLPITWP